MYEKHFESTEEVLKYVQETPLNNGILCEYPSSDKRGSGDSWTKEDSFEEAIESATRGDIETGNSIVPSYLDCVDSSTRKATNYYDVSGDSVDIGRFLSGNPECMINRGKKGKPLVTVVYNATQSAFVDEASVRGKGRAILTLVTSLEQSGYSVAVVAIIASTGSSRPDFIASIKIKDHSEYIDLAKLGYWLVSSSVGRRVGFRLKELSDPTTQMTIGRAYGRPVELESRDLERYGDCIYLSPVRTNGKSWCDYFASDLLPRISDHGINGITRVIQDRAFRIE